MRTFKSGQSPRKIHDFQRYNRTSLHFYKVIRFINICLRIVVEYAATEVFKNWFDKKLGLFYIGLILSWQWTIWTQLQQSYHIQSVKVYLKCVFFKVKRQNQTAGVNRQIVHYCEHRKALTLRKLQSRGTELQWTEIDISPSTSLQWRACVSESDLFSVSSLTEEPVHQLCHEKYLTLFSWNENGEQKTLKLERKLNSILNKGPNLAKSLHDFNNKSNNHGLSLNYQVLIL